MNFGGFFWDGYHWLPPAILYLPVNEGGQGLIDLAAKVKVRWLKTAQNLLYPVEKAMGGVWSGFALNFWGVRSTIF